MRVHVYEIKWDTDGKRVRGLPSELVVHIPDDHLIDYGFDGLIERAIELATRSTGWLIGDSSVRADVFSAPEWYNVDAFNRYCGY
jgi:hypothetical protein